MEESESEKFFLELPPLEEKLCFFWWSSPMEGRKVVFFGRGEVSWKEGRLLFFWGVKSNGRKVGRK